MSVTRVVVVALVLAAAASGTAGAVLDGENDAVAAAGAETCSFPFSKVDATGTEVTVSAEPERIVTLAPSAAQTVWEVGGREKVVGVSQFAAYLEGADSRANVSGAGQTMVNVEKVVSLEPDLVLAPDIISNETVGKLRDAGLTVYKFRSPESIEGVAAKTRLTGTLTGECEGAAATADEMASRLATVEDAVAGADRPRVLYVFFGYTAGEGTFIDEIITTAGGTNVAAEAGITGFAKISDEVVVEQDPEWILVNDGATSLPANEAYNGTTAVEEDQIVVVREPYISQPAPRMLESVVTLTKALHPEAYERAVNEAAATTTATTAAETEATTAATATESNAPETTAGGGDDGSDGGESSAAAPGFGALAALVAVAAVVLMTRRR